MSLSNGEGDETHCLIQVVRGADNCLVTPENDVHSVLRQYRAQQGSKPPLEGPSVEGGCVMPLQLTPKTIAACISHPCGPEFA